MSPGSQLGQRSGRFRGYGNAHHTIHNGPLTRLVFTPKDHGRLHRCAVRAVEASNNVTGGGKEAEGEHDRPPHDEPTGDSVAGDSDEDVAA